MVTSLTLLVKNNHFRLRKTEDVVLNKWQQLIFRQFSASERLESVSQLSAYLFERVSLMSEKYIQSRQGLHKQVYLFLELENNTYCIRPLYFSYTPSTIYLLGIPFNQLHEKNSLI